MTDYQSRMTGGKLNVPELLQITLGSDTECLPVNMTHMAKISVPLHTKAQGKQLIFDPPALKGSSAAKSQLAWIHSFSLLIESDRIVT